MPRGRGHPSTGTSVALAALLARRLDALSTHTAGARRGTVEGVHQSRVASRRLREAVPVAATGLSGVKRKWLLRRLRAVTKSLGPARDCDVSLAALQQVDASGDRAVGQVLRAWRTSLRAERREASAGLHDALASATMATLSERLAHLASVRAASTDASWTVELADRLDGRSRRFRQRIEQAGALFVPERLHDVRIAGKQLRYMLEIANECRLASAARLLSTLKRAQDTLGRMQDLDVLLRRLRDMSETAVPDSSAIERLAAAFDLERRTLHAVYLRRRDALIRLADDVRDTIVPRLSERLPAAGQTPSDVQP